MEVHILPILTFLSMALAVVSHAALPAETYWNEVLPNTAMPKAVKMSLPGLERMEDKGSFLKDGKISCTSYQSFAAEAPLNYDPTLNLFFLEKEIKTGSRMNLRFTTTTNGATFLPKEEVESLPFSTDKMSKIIQEFSVHPGSEEAKIIEETIKECERKGIKGENKYCATSLESMVDYVTSNLGKNIKALSTEAKDNDKVEKYTITGVRKVVEGNDKTAVCHKQNYPYAIFYCHKFKATSTYTVTLLGTDGSTVRAVAMCHKDTSAWNPKHLAFQLAKVKPGHPPLCHFLPNDHIVWVKN